jgi:hypothetical protein
MKKLLSLIKSTFQERFMRRQSKCSIIFVRNFLILKNLLKNDFEKMPFVLELYINLSMSDLAIYLANIYFLKKANNITA